MRLLVTGGCGFIGTNLVRYLLHKYKDLAIVNVDKMSYGSNEKSIVGLGRRHRFVKGDIVDQSLMNTLIRDVDGIVNVAAESHVDRSISNPWPFFESNVKGVITILESMRASGRDIRMVQVGTDEVYGSLARGAASENSKTNPSSPYAASKAAADSFCMAYYKTYGLNLSISRCTNNFGPYQFPEKLIPKTIIRAKLGLKVPLYGSGKNVREWIYVEDHCEAIDAILRKGKKGEVYNVTAGNQISNATIVEKILKIVRRPKRLLEFVEDRPGHDLRYSLNSEKIVSELGWHPRHNFLDALSKTVSWYVRNESWWRPLVSEALNATPWR